MPFTVWFQLCMCFLSMNVWCLTVQKALSECLYGAWLAAWEDAAADRATYLKDGHILVSGIGSETVSHVFLAPTDSWSSTPQTFNSECTWKKINACLGHYSNTNTWELSVLNLSLAHEHAFTDVCVNAWVVTPQDAFCRTGMHMFRMWKRKQLIRVETGACTCAVAKQRHGVHSVMQTQRQHFNVLFIRGGKASGVFNSTTATTAAKLLACLFFGPRWAGNFHLRKNVLENVHPVIHFLQ